MLLSLDMIELQHDRVSFSTIDTWMLEQIFKNYLLSISKAFLLLLYLKCFSFWAATSMVKTIIGSFCLFVFEHVRHLY